MVKRAQSALEYMMTYGWAILIIVIVAAVLYSMGIFNPSSSVTTTSSGFSPFSPAAAVCNTSGIWIQFSTGGLPNSASSANLNWLSITATTGINASSNISLTQTVSSSSTFTVKDAKAACTSSGVKFSGSGSLRFTTVGTLGAAYTATGTVAGTSS